MGKTGSNKKLTLAIVIPVYNEEGHLKACLESIKNQLVAPDEVIIVDNNSSDKSAVASKSYKFVKVIKEPRQGVVFARTTGFNATKADIIGRLDADTILDKDWTSRVLDFYGDPNHKNQALTGGCYFYNIRLPNLIGWWQGQIAFRYNRLLMGHYILFGSNMAMPKQLWHEVKNKLCSDTDVHEDLDLAIHLHRLGYQITYRESLRVGVMMKRVLSRRNELWDNIMWWPKTLRKHGKKTWVFGWIAAVLFYVISPIAPATERLARWLGRQPHNE